MEEEKEKEEIECTFQNQSDTIEPFSEETFFRLFQFIADWYVYPQERAQRLLARILRALSDQPNNSGTRRKT